MDLMQKAQAHPSFLFLFNFLSINALAENNKPDPHRQPIQKPLKPKISRIKKTPDFLQNQGKATTGK